MKKTLFIKPELTSNTTTKVEVVNVKKFLKDLYNIFPDAEVRETPTSIIYKSFVQPKNK